MIDYTTHLQVPGRIADRHAEARARRLAAEAAPANEHRSVFTAGIHAAAASGRTAFARLRDVRVKSGPALRPARDRA